jgi:hypothetical protein
VATQPLADGDLRSRLHATLIAGKQLHIADAVEHSGIDEAANELIITTPKMYVAYLKQAGFDAAVLKVLGRAIRITIKIEEAGAGPGNAAPVGQALSSANAPQGDETAQRALANPEVQRFQEMFPDSQVRTVRNLREN